MKALLSYTVRRWCHVMHPAPRWPIHGQYECPTCLRRYPVPWANQILSDSSESTEPPVRSAGMVIQHAHS
jgi:hypothetical protein